MTPVEPSRGPDRRLTLVGTILAHSGLSGLAVPNLRAHLLAIPEIAAEWDVTSMLVSHVIDEATFSEEAVARILDSEPDILGVSCNCWDTAAQLDLVRRVRARLPGTHIVAGGSSASSQGSRLLDSTDALDVVACGEGERALAELLRRPWAGLDDIPGIHWRHPDGEVHSNGGAFPFLSFDELVSPTLSGTHRPWGHEATFEFARGCPFRCKFCDWKSGGTHLRHASFERMRDELRWARDAGYGYVFVTDSAINNSSARLELLCEAAHVADPTSRLQHCYFHNLPLLDERQLRVLAKLNTSTCEVGLNSVNPRALQMMSRSGFDREGYARRLERLAERHPVALHVLLGIPGDDLRGYVETLDYTERLIARVGRDRIRQVRVLWMILPPGSELSSERRERGIHVREQGIPYCMGTRRFPLEDMAQAVRLTQRHDVGEHCVFDGPREVLSPLATAPFFMHRGIMVCEADGVSLGPPVYVEGAQP